MRQGRLLDAALTLAAALGLSGCVAVAIPVVAGGALARTVTDGVDASVEVAAAPAPETPAGPDPLKAQAARDTLIRMSQEGSLEPSQNPAMAVVSKSAATSTAPLAKAAIAPKASSPFAEFALYAASKAALHAEASLSGGERAPSAILADPASLNSKRQDCNAAEAVVLIDLDTAGALYAPEMTLSADPAFARELADLRAKEIAVAWISGASAAYAGDLKVALRSTGLDPAGKDQILMMRYPGDRKQTRREELSSAACLLAIAGDERADFDELFRYLTRPEAALGLELLIGDGWFLVPSLIAPSFQTPDLVSKDTNTQ